MRLSAIDSIQHGLLNLRANWQLLIVLFLQTLMVAALSVLGFVPIVLVLGFAFLRGVMTRMNSSGGLELFERILEVALPLIVAALAATLIWTLAFVVYCYFQGGVFGVLAAGERRALSEGVRWQNYRAFSKRSFFRLAEELTWPVFWLVNLFFVIGLAAVAGFGLVGLGFVALLGEGPQPILILLGCFGLFLLVLCMIFISVWMQLALAQLAAGTRGVIAAANAALAVAIRRLPGVALLFLLLFVASIVLAIVLMPLSLVLEVALRDRMGAYLAGQALVTLVQWLVSGILTVTWSATFVALVVGEHEAAP